ncbi:hypothetical protein LINGRAHAP2_LOCUS3870 [Linum grandiflorum]
MEFWDKVIFPVRRAWTAVSARVKSRKHGSGSILILHNDVQTCGYEDVQVMWEMLRRSETEMVAGAGNLQKRNRRSFWRVFMWSNHRSSASSSAASPLSADMIA